MKVVLSDSDDMSLCLKVAIMCQELSAGPPVTPRKYTSTYIHFSGVVQYPVMGSHHCARGLR